MLSALWSVRLDTGLLASAGHKSLYIVGGIGEWCSHSGKQLGSSSKCSTEGYHPRELKIYVQANICTQIFTAALFITDRKYKQPKRPWTDEWISKTRHHHTGNCIQSSQGTKTHWFTLQCAQMNSENAALSEGSQTQKVTYYMITPTRNVYNRQIHRQNVDQWPPGTRGRE